jgi:metal-dependent hydrolase (beta-lactamase superfamily II)
MMKKSDIVKNVEITVVYDNVEYDPEYTTGFGFSAFIEATVETGDQLL